MLLRGLASGLQQKIAMLTHNTPHCYCINATVDPKQTRPTPECYGTSCVQCEPPSP